MKMIFCKSTENRKREFQIYTCILISDAGEKYVIKKAVYEEGKAHLEKMLQNHQRLQTICQGKVVDCQNTKEGICFPYVKGRTFAQELKEKLRQDESLEYWKEVISEWKQMLIGNQNNITVFDNSTEFQKIFGNAGCLQGDCALKLTNFDCIAENIIVQGKIPCFIDYEWFFDFPVPVDFAFFRILRQFSMDNCGRFTLERLLEAAEIMDENRIREYERLLDNFEQYVSYDKENNIQYPNLGKIFKQPCILEQEGDEKIKFQFPADEISKGSRILLYGAGDVGMSFYHYLRNNEEYTLVKWVDKKYVQYREYGYNVCEVNSIKKQVYDCLLIAVYNENVAEEIRKELATDGVEVEKMVWIKPKYA